MANEKQLASVFQPTAANVPQQVFIADADLEGTIMTSITVSNDSTSNASYKAYIGPLTPPPTKALLPKRTVKIDRTDIPPELTAQIVPPGEALWIETSVLSSIAITVSGRDLT